MTKIYLLLSLFPIFFLGNCQSTTTSDSSHQNFNPELIKAELLASTSGWNEGDLADFLATYDSAATFMTSKGVIGLAQLKVHYQQKYFDDNQPRQKLTFEELVVKPLGSEYALVTGKYVLSGDKQPEQSGRFSLIFRGTKNGWKIVHDHSS